MNLITQFPEIDKFFKKNEFTQEEFNTLLSRITDKYQDSAIINSAKTLIELELLKYKLIQISSEGLKKKIVKNLSEETKIIGTKTTNSSNRDETNIQKAPRRKKPSKKWKVKLQKAIKRKKKNKKYAFSISSAYDKLKLYGPGKFIYTRSRY